MQCFVFLLCYYIVPAPVLIFSFYFHVLGFFLEQPGRVATLIEENEVN